MCYQHKNLGGKSILVTADIKLFIESETDDFSTGFDMLGIASRLDSSNEVLKTPESEADKSNSRFISPATDCVCWRPCKCSRLLCRLWNHWSQVRQYSSSLSSS